MNKEEIAIYDLIGDQSPTASQDANNHQVFFRVPVTNGAGQTVDFKLHRVVCNAVRAYYSLDELLGDTNVLPENSRQYTVEQQMKFVAVDSRLGFGSKVQDYPLVAYAGKSAFDKPIAQVRGESGIVRYYASPIFSNLVKKV